MVIFELFSVNFLAWQAINSPYPRTALSNCKISDGRAEQRKGLASLLSQPHSLVADLS